MITTISPLVQRKMINKHIKSHGVLTQEAYVELQLVVRTLIEMCIVQIKPLRNKRVRPKHLHKAIKDYAQLLNSKIENEK